MIYELIRDKSVLINEFLHNKNFTMFYNIYKTLILINILITIIVVNYNIII